MMITTTMKYTKSTNVDYNLGVLSIDLAAALTCWSLLIRYWGRPTSKELQYSIRDNTSEQTRVLTASIDRRFRMELIRLSLMYAAIQTLMTCWCSKRVLMRVTQVSKWRAEFNTSVVNIHEFWKMLHDIVLIPESSNSRVT